MKWDNAPIEGVLITRLQKNVDERGFLVEIQREDELPRGIKSMMTYVTFSLPGVSRGPHEHREQTDTFTFIGPGNFLIKLWDNRCESKTYGSYWELKAGQDYPISLVVPAGVVHWYKNISKQEMGMVINCPDKLYKGWGKAGLIDEIRHEDDPNNPFKV